MRLGPCAARGARRRTFAFDAIRACATTCGPGVTRCRTKCPSTSSSLRRSSLRRTPRQDLTQLRHLSIRRASTAPAAAPAGLPRKRAATTPMPSSAASGDDEKKAGTPGAPRQEGGAASLDAKNKGGTVDDELWIVGRMMEKVEERLGAKQEKLRRHEVGVIERYALIISGLDQKLEPPDGDEFLSWLDASGFRQARAVSESREDAPVTGHSASNGEYATGGARGEREKVQAFLSAATARLDALVADRENSVFGDREIGPTGAHERREGTVTNANERHAAVANVEMDDDEVYQAKVTAHRALLCNCLSHLSESLEKEHLKPGIRIEDVATAAKLAYLAAPNDRLAAVFPLFDTHCDGHLDAESVERAMDAVVLPVTAAIQRCYSAAARLALDKKAVKAMPPTMKYVLWDVMEVPIKRRCAFAWAEERKQVGPDEWRVSWEQFASSRMKHFPELDSLASTYISEYSRRRSAWHNKHKGRKKATVYGLALFFGVVFVDNVLAGI